ncbi:MAG TPA: phosphatase PAP2 family protein [Gaiella sp.]|uniref:phosphatase PAP2 family protein n=1 Tax=Gaiella sp. TaxID=2663207 RepID=UPI002D80C14F|nr:phosphatase PAP2 family protein [Gaiella sp.]HET9287294.1 phosphatase PAP2 family protein [Gaiella sp.]
MVSNGSELRTLDPAESTGTKPVSGLKGLGAEAGLIAAAMLLYFGIRNLTAGNADTAFVNADRLVELERWLGIDWESALQSATVRSDAVVTLANWVYIWGHWPVILGVATVLFIHRRSHYYLLRNAMFASGLIGFAFFALFPVAPPRLIDMGLVDTVTQRSDAYRALQPPGLTNQYAAFPSLHAGWNLLVAIVVAMAVAGVALRLVALALPIAMSLAVVLTANHFVIDVAGGVLVVLVGLAIAIWIQGRRNASTLRLDGTSGDRGGPPRSHARVRRRASGRELPGQAA